LVRILPLLRLDLKKIQGKLQAGFSSLGAASGGGGGDTSSGGQDPALVRRR
jgi:hypothetical protein